jgi:hypothetical protein
MPDEGERLRLEYAQANELLRTLTDVRFKLLAFVPTIAGAAVALLGGRSSPAELLAVGALGLVASAGVVLYELRNSELYDYTLARVEVVERELGLALLGGRPRHRHDRPLALVYAAALGGWAYLVAWGAFAVAGVADAQRYGGAVALVAAVGVAGALLGADDLDEPAPVALAVQLDEEHPLPRAEL